MAQFDRNHYVPNFLLKNFASNNKENSKYKICIMDLKNFQVAYRNTDRAFYQKKLYDVIQSEDNKVLEKKFGEKIEEPMSALLKNIEESSDTIELTRQQVELIKKYFLLQLYRTPRNKQCYTNEQKLSFELSQFNIKPDETKEEFWKREMLTIIENDWDALISSDMVGIKRYATELNSNFLLFWKTESEFCINDIGYVVERIPITIPKDMEEIYINDVKQVGKVFYGYDNFDEVAREEIRNQNSYIDNFILFPISSNRAILLVNPIWKHIIQNGRFPYGKYPIKSNILPHHLSFPENQYVNKTKITTIEDIIKYKDSKDIYKYCLHCISAEETTYLNLLLINEAYCYIALKSPKIFLNDIQEYNKLSNYGIQSVKHNLNGFEELLDKLSPL